jgi:hypothetical protein
MMRIGLIPDCHHRDRAAGQQGSREVDIYIYWYAIGERAAGLE